MNLALRLARLEAVLTGGPRCRDPWHYGTHPSVLTYPQGDPFNRPAQPLPAGATCPTCGQISTVEVRYVEDWRGVASGDSLPIDTAHT